MQTPFPFEPFLTFGTMAVFLLIGVFLRAKVTFLQRFLMPSCLIAGVIGLVLISTGVLPTPVKSLETIAYHFFIISFISVGFLFMSEVSAQKESEKTKDLKLKSILKGSFWMALIEGITLPIQAIIGSLFVILFGLAGYKLYPTFGLLLPLGFTEGPGQALSFGKVWEGFGFEHAATLGLTFAAIGFLFAFFVGVPLVNWGIRLTRGKGEKKELPRDLVTGIIPKDQEKEESGKLTLHSGNIDSLAFHTALIGVVYLLTYGFIFLMGKAFSPSVTQSLWGFFFFFGMFIAMFVGWIMKKIGVIHLVDSGTQRRITGWAIDFLIVATVMAIQFQIVWTYIVPIAVMSIFSGIATILVLVYFGKRIDSYNLERMAVMFGTCTGTVSSGLLLLRITDPEFKTPVALEVGVMNILVAPIILACMVLVNAHIWWQWNLPAIIAAFTGLLILCLLLMKLLKYWGKPKF
ncbi:hypothetical protein KJ966_22830 [bacterium]|nr:hypothetical protein [bacterium]